MSLTRGAFAPRALPASSSSTSRRRRASERRCGGAGAPVCAYALRRELPLGRDTLRPRHPARTLRARAGASKGARGDRPLARAVGGAGRGVAPKPARPRRLQYRPRPWRPRERLRLDRPPSCRRARRASAHDLRQPEEAHYYDQIAWFTDPARGPALTLRCTGSNYFDFVPLLQESLTKTQLSWHISDHPPLWSSSRYVKELDDP